MKRIVYIILIVFIFSASLAALSACNKTPTTFRFKYSSYTIYMDEGVELKPEMIIAPFNDNYTISSSNINLVKVLDDNKTVRAVKKETSTVTLTATCGAATVSATLITLTTRTDDAPNIPDLTYTVTFNTGGWGSIASQSIVPGGTATRPSYNNYADYMIADWYTDSEFKTVYNFSSKVTSNLTLYALWVQTDTPTFTYEDKNKNGEYYITGLLYPYVDYGDIVIPSSYKGSPVVGISENAFYRKDTSTSTSTSNVVKIKSVVIPASVKVIEKNAFYRCSNLTSVYFEGDSNLISIGVSAFSYCEKLTTITLPEKLQTIDEYAFEQCIALPTLNLPDSLSKIAIGAFSSCKKLNISPTLPKNLTQISADSFKNTSVKSIDLKYIKKIGTQAFYGTSPLATISNTQNIEVIEADAFTGTAWITAAEKINSTYIILDDILILCKATGSTTAGVYTTVPENIRLVAGSAFPAKTIYNGFVQFTSQKAPVFNSYAFGSTGVDIWVPKEKMTEYRTNIYAALGMSKMNLYYEDKTVLTGLTLFVNEYTEGEVNLIIQKFESTQSIVNLTTIFNQKYPSKTINIRKIKTGAFSTKASLPNLVRLYLPIRLWSLEASCFANLPNTLFIYLEGEFGKDYSPNAANIPSSASTLQTKAYFYVPKAYYDTYTYGWSSLQNSIDKY